ncbi:hypothetical protein RN001_008990 [Aquatica leii]|uniref:Uncharacterized protein n=1 Tax=Aquatica leii TaxID=1421715 RepID=A0AAN7SHS9_9COLE|nr:hypothetical protein RN001_008990 [Aquatica leii]
MEKIRLRNPNALTEKKILCILEDSDFDLDEIPIGSYCILKYDDEYYPAKIVHINEQEYYCCTMTKSGIDHWKWPDKNDLLWSSFQDIVQKIEKPKLANNRGAFLVPEMHKY